MQETPAIECEFSIALTCAVDTLWQSVTSIDGINFELMPFLSMESRAGAQQIGEIEPRDGLRTLPIVLRLCGIFHLKRLDVHIVEVDEFRFVEQSKQPGMAWWQHERVVERTRRGARLTDRLTFLPHRFPDLSRRFVEHLFLHRHKRLAARWNAMSEPA